MRLDGSKTVSSTVTLLTNTNSEVHKVPNDPNQLTAAEDGPKWDELSEKPDLPSLPGVKAVWPPSPAEMKASIGSTRVITYCEALQTLYEVIIPNDVHEKVFLSVAMLASFMRRFSSLLCG